MKRKQRKTVYIEISNIVLILKPAYHLKMFSTTNTIIQHKIQSKILINKFFHQQNYVLNGYNSVIVVQVITK